MSEKIIENKDFEGINYTGETLEKAIYDSCRFLHCDFSRVNLSELVFVDCTFEGCNLGNVVMENTSFRDTDFKGCKLLGVPFEKCKPTLLSFRSEEHTSELQSQQ